MRVEANMKTHQEVAPRTGAWVAIGEWGYWQKLDMVAPRTGAWVAINRDVWRSLSSCVAPRTGAWVAIVHSHKLAEHLIASLLVQERGLQFGMRRSSCSLLLVAPRTGAWVAIVSSHFLSAFCPVAPRTGAWVAIFPLVHHKTYKPSLLVQERGLQFTVASALASCAASLLVQERGLQFNELAGIWIELRSLLVQERGLQSSPLRR